MVIMFNVSLFLVGWITIVILYGLSNSYLSMFEKSELIADGNNLFKTGSFYSVLTAVVYFINSPVVFLIVIAIMIIFTILPIISVIRMFKMVGVSREQKVSAVISQGIPLLMVLNLFVVR